MHRSPGFVFLDSAREIPSSQSLLAWEPDTILAGGLAQWPLLIQELERRMKPSVANDPSQGAAIGWLAFDGSYCFGFYEDVLIFDHGTKSWNGDVTGLVDRRNSGFASSLPHPDFQPAMCETEYMRMVQRAKAYISAGDIYQVCLAHPFFAEGRFDAFHYYEALRVASPAPYAGYLDLGGLKITSTSPELFLRIRGREITTRPIKGTRPRFVDPAKDEHSAQDLRTSAKENAELVMITDMERNDLGRICEYGSVRVPALLELEHFEQVHHLVSTVSGTLRGDVSHAEALRLCSPGGSISGAPKSRALEIIAELEPFARGLYTGSFGYFGFQGESQFAMAIRTAVFGEDHASFFVGAGIVADSVPELEWQETLYKASGLLAASRLREHA